MLHIMETMDMLIKLDRVLQWWKWRKLCIMENIGTVAVEQGKR